MFNIITTAINISFIALILGLIIVFIRDICLAKVFQNTNKYDKVWSILNTISMTFGMVSLTTLLSILVCVIIKTIVFYC